jgi:hypothetical protein
MSDKKSYAVQQFLTDGWYAIEDSEMNAVVAALELYVNNTNAIDIGEAGDLLRRLRQTQADLKEQGRI